MNRSPCFFVVVLLFASLVGIDAHATLLSRLGGAAVYDSDANLTWLANANAAAGSAYDNGASAHDGRLTWSSALAWAAALEVGGVTGWRLPTTVQPDPTCSTQTGGGRISFGFGCSNSEMGHLFYTVLGGSGLPFTPPPEGILGSGDPDLALFTNIQSTFGAGGIYHSSTVFNAANNWRFNFNNGGQTFENKIYEHFAWAVHDGDVGGAVAVPVPSTAWALVLAMLGLVLPLSRRGLRT